MKIVVILYKYRNVTVH